MTLLSFSAVVVVVENNIFSVDREHISKLLIVLASLADVCVCLVASDRQVNVEERGEEKET